jgi:hypothetical protein
VESTGKIVGLDLDFLNHKPKLTIQLNRQDILTTDEFTKLKDEDLLDIEIKKHTEKRSLNANAYFHLLINKLARKQNISDEEMKVKMNLQYGTIATDEEGKIIGCKLPKGTNINQFYPYSRWYKEDKDGCDCYLFYKRTHHLNKNEFSKLINGVVSECKESGIETLDEIELEKLLEKYEGDTYEQN